MLWETQSHSETLASLLHVDHHLPGWPSTHIFIQRREEGENKFYSMNDLENCDNFRFRFEIDLCQG